MECGGNKAWREFWEGHEEGGVRERRMGRKVVWGGVVRERYDGVVGEEWKERLGCKVEGREYVPLLVVKPVEKTINKETVTEVGMGAGGRKQQNEAFFSRLGSENASRSEDLSPYQGGKYSGFGSNMQSQSQQQQHQQTNSQGRGASTTPALVDEFQKDPVAALTKSLGWFTSAVGKQAKSVNDGWLQPNMQKVQSTISPILIIPQHPSSTPKTHTNTHNRLV